MNGLWQLDYNTRVVLAGTGLLGAACGLIGVFLLLRKRALVGDAISHATLPGVCGAYLLANAMGAEGKSLVVLLVGAAFSGSLGALTIVFLRRWTRLKEDAALGIVLSVYFGVGTALLRWIQSQPQGNAAGLEGFILGKTALMVTEDVWVIGIACLLVISIVVLLNKELRLLCFDRSFADSQGWPTTVLDLSLMASVVTVVIVGLQAVGLILVIALLVIPAASARFWTHRLMTMLLISMAVGSMSGMVGAMLSSMFDRLPSGAAIVLVAMMAFLVSLFLGWQRGLFWRWKRLYRHRAVTDEQHVLRGIYEILELRNATPLPVGSLQAPAIESIALKNLRHWSKSRMNRALSTLHRDGSLVTADRNRLELSAKGIRLATELVRRHRLLEQYFQRQAEWGYDAIDRGADLIEHDIDDEMMAELEGYLGDSASTVPASLHPIGTFESMSSHVLGPTANSASVHDSQVSPGGPGKPS